MNELRKSALTLALLVLLLAHLAGCAQSSGCESICKHYAECKLESQLGGERMMGERKMPADPGCMDRCAKGGDAFAACEGTKKTCEALLACSGGK